MKIEVNSGNEQGKNKVSNREKRETKLFENIFNKNLKKGNGDVNITKNKKEVSPINENVESKLNAKRQEKIDISLQKLVKLEKNITKPEEKKEISKLIDDLIIENKKRITNSKDSISLKEIREKISSGNLDIKVEIKKEKLTKIMESLDKNNKQVIEMKNELITKEAKTENVETKEKSEKNKMIFPSEEQNIGLQNTETTENSNVKPHNLRKINKSDDYDSKNNIFEEIKKQRIEIQNSNVSKEVNFHQHNHSNWQVASVKESPMKMGDWISSFKQEIDKLADFRIENRQKVSLLLKEQDEQLRIVVEKRESYILVEADMTDSMKDKLDGILSEVKSEMRDKGIEVRIELKQNKDSEEERNKKDNQSQGGKQNNNGSRQRNKSN
ncbi:hypothetical protein AAGG74_18340 [Bacillus mexicanus]|uniref:hypothetical protein n=1 Tax=Bacillus mexicanus TaxID=2834415 RepID=UPI003D2367DC